MGYRAAGRSGAFLLAVYGCCGALIQKNEQLEDFISKQSDAINACDQRLKQLDEKNMFYSDDEIGWFFKEVQKIQEALNEFTLK